MARDFILASLAIIASLTGCAARAEMASPLWIDRAEVRPWLPALSRAADRSGLPVPLIAELVGIESQFQSVKNSRSSAFGFGQQITSNSVMRVCRLDRAKPEESILGAALEFRDKLARYGTIARAADAYGTTANLSPARRNGILARLDRAARWVPVLVAATPAVPGRTQMEAANGIARRSR